MGSRYFSKNCTNMDKECVCERVFFRQLCSRAYLKVKSTSSYEGTKKMVGAGSVPSLDTSFVHVSRDGTPRI